MAVVKLKRVFDGWANLLTGLGVSGKDKRLSLEAYWERMDQSTAEDTYAGDDVFAKIVDMLPEEAVREWIKISGIDGVTERKLLEGCEAFEIKERLCWAWKLSRIYGGAALLMVVDDGKDLSEPLDIKSVRSLKSLVPFNRWELVAAQFDTDFTSMTFGEPTVYRLTPQTTTDANLAEIHASRLLKFDGVQLPRRLYVRNNYWGDSILSRVQNALKNFNSEHDSAASVMQDFTTDVFKMKNLAELVAAGRENDIKTRIELANMSKSIIKAVVLDLEEDYEVKARSLSGVPDLLTKADNRLTIASGMPHTLLLGESPGGLGTTGQNQVKNWYDFVKRQQEIQLTKKINVLLKLIAKTLSIELPAEYSWKYNPLWQMSDTEQAAYRKTVADTDAVYIDRGVVDATEIAASRFGGEGYSAETNLDTETRERQAITPPISEATVDSICQNDGGPGSGCSGNNCGRPSSGSSDKEFSKLDKKVESAGNKYDKNPSSENKSALESAIQARNEHVKSKGEKLQASLEKVTKTQEKIKSASEKIGNKSDIEAEISSIEEQLKNLEKRKKELS